MADDLTRPFIGYRSAGRRPESQQDRRAAADAPLSALRGAVSGVLGAPGDIESLIRMLPGLSEQTVLPTSEDVEKRLPMRELNQTPTGKAFTTAGQLGGGFYTGPGSPLRAVAALPSAVSRAGRDFLMAGSPVNVVKPKGGNWLAGSVEHSVEPMKTRVIGQDPASRLRDLDAAYAQNVEAGVAMDPAVFARERARLEPEVAMNRWLETKLGKYIRNEMATPEDPLRALAERGIMHSEITPTGYNVARARQQAGFPEEGMGVSPMAKAWEDRADTFINELKASDLTSGYPEAVESNPWLLKVPPETRVYEMLRGVDEDLGFAHLTDELRNAINPESGLPRELMLKYSDLEKVTVPQAVERVSKINEWRAAQKAEADMARAMGPATQVVKEYPEQGFKWVELRAPDGDKFEESIQHLEPKEWQKAVEEFREGRTKALEDALKYEGETMGHCVGGYCPDVSEGRSKIYSLRDKKGQPHVTIEVRPASQRIAPRHEEILAEMKASGVDTSALSESSYDAAYEQALQRVKQSRPPEIVQIKGKANRAPKEEYLPAVQDFVRSGNFGKVGDLGNAGLYRKSDFIDEFNPQQLDAIGQSEYITFDEIKKLREGKNWKPIDTDPDLDIDIPGFARGGAVRGYQTGGAVHTLQDLHQRYAEGGAVTGAIFPTEDFDPARIDAIVASLNAEFQA